MRARPTRRVSVHRRGDNSAEANAQRICAVLEDLSASYCILWTPSASNGGRLRAGSHCALDGGMMEHSLREQYRPGVGAVGRVWAARNTELVRNANAATVAQFDRVHLASYHGVRSIALSFEAGSVVEVGTTLRTPWDKAPDVRALRLLLAGKDVAMKSMPKPFAPPKYSQESLANVVRASGGEYGIFWQHLPTLNELKAIVWYAHDNECMRRSSTFAFAPGAGHVGRAWLSQEPGLLADVHAPEGGAFERRLLAVHYGIRSIAFVPTCGSVFEIGTQHVWERIPELHTDQLFDSLDAAMPAFVVSPESEHEYEPSTDGTASP
ncbi:hypothetical protein KFE25_013398 [Diacronema lutheri]|uniref:Uncharacterized protein n=2 Tax=Diacronema lutheri TaxID=2081491 RepID=A0A8J5XUS1_DIALT|nr:hypothetical protein KFE25_013398 [Diacronema lutheri]